MMISIMMGGSVSLSLGVEGVNLGEFSLFCGFLRGKIISKIVEIKG